MVANPKLIDLSGQRFARWSVLAQSGNTSRGGALWLARCDCGTERVVLGTDLRNGKSQSCGCLRTERTGSLRRTHASSGTRLHTIWKNIRGRTLHFRAGYEGIKLCADWCSFEAFRDWALANGYRDDLTIDRIDYDGDYEPSNCRWADLYTQAQNRRNVILMPDGTPAIVVARKHGIPGHIFRRRLHEGWDLERAVSWPYGKLRTARSRNQKGQFS